MLIGTAGSAQAATERRESLSSIVTATGRETRGITHLPGEVLFMRGFDFRYLKDDHHIETIGVFPNTNTSLIIAFRDRNGDDPMEYEVSLTKVTLAGVISPPHLHRTCHGGTCSFPLQAPPNRDYIFVLRGFWLSFLPDDPDVFPVPDNCNVFRGCDHHLSVVGIELDASGNNIAVTYQDNNGDDDYAVSIAYSYVPRSLVQGFGISTGTVDDAGTDHKNIDTSGTVAITGFRIGYVPVAGLTPPLPDHHIRRFGYQFPRTGGIDVSFGDKNPDRKWEHRLTFVRFE
jgi:hypothetical protein